MRLCPGALGFEGFSFEALVFEQVVGCSFFLLKTDQQIHTNFILKDVPLQALGLEGVFVDALVSRSC